MKVLMRGTMLPIVLFIVSIPLNGQPTEARMALVQGRTKDGVIFQISNRTDNYKLGEKIIIDYVVRNLSARTVYLVMDSEVEHRAKDNVIWVESPIKYPDEFQAYNYEFLAIPRKKSYKGTITLESNKLPFDKDYDKESWKIQVGFAYLFSVEGLFMAKRSMGVEPYLHQVAERAITLNLGSLSVVLDN